MTKCKRKRCVFKRLRRQAVEVNFEGGTLTSDGGLVLLREVDRRLALQGTEHHRLRVDTIRLRLLKIASPVRVTARRVVFQLCSHCRWKELFESTQARL